MEVVGTTEVAIPEIPGLQIMSLEEDIGPMRLLAYGPSGSGKTHLMGTVAEVPEMCPALFVDFDRGTRTLRKFVGKGRVDVVHVDGNAEWSRVSRFIRGKDCPYKTVILDDLNELYDVLMRARLKSKEGQAGREPGIPWQEDWMRIHYQIRAMLRVLRKQPYHLLATTLEALNVDAQSEIIIRMPMMPGKLAPEVGKYFDYVLYMSVRSKKYTASTQLGARLIAKARGDLPDLIVNPHMGTIRAADLEGAPEFESVEEPEEAEGGATEEDEGNDELED